MTHMGQKVQLVKDFGVERVKRNISSLITNKIDDEGIVNRKGRGVRDQKIMDQVDKMDREIEESRKKAGNEKSKKDLFSRDALLSDDVLELIDYKDIY